jgi:hypothetical protein
MAFMQPEVLDKQEWAEVETSAGVYWVPFDVLAKNEAASARRGDFEPLLKYTEGTEVYSDQSSIKKGYGVRLSAPGYMDSTDWEVYSSKKEALRRAHELEREAEGEDYATKKRSHATAKKSTAQLDREIKEALSSRATRSTHATVKTESGERLLKCDMSEACEEPVTHLDEKGFVYCTKHGVQRRGSGHRCRKLKPSELRQLKSGQPLAKY